MAQPADIGLIGLAVMGRNLALNLADRGYRVAVFNRTARVTDDFVATVGDRPVAGYRTLAEFVAALRPPRVLLLMVKAGAPVDAQLDDVLPLLTPGDTVIDGGNAHYADSQRRAARLAEGRLLFLGAGISGGEEGARHGPAIMAGGDPAAYRLAGPMLESIAAQADGEPCCGYVGADGAGHFVKMVHNGIEYAVMQAIGEAYVLLRDGADCDHVAMAGMFADWAAGETGSYLLEITAAILATNDPDTGRPLVEVIADQAGHKGTGVWTSISGLETGVPVPNVAAAVFARALSGQVAMRAAVQNRFAASAATAASPDLAAAIKGALDMATFCAYDQGFALMAAASESHNWQLDLGQVSKIWRGGCIVRARYLDEIAAAYGDRGVVSSLLTVPWFAQRVAATVPDLRRVLAVAITQGLPCPGMSTALAYFDSLRQPRLWTNLVQAQRDYFGAHGYGRIDRPGQFHTAWTRDGGD